MRVKLKGAAQWPLIYAYHQDLGTELADQDCGRHPKLYCLGTDFTGGCKDHSSSYYQGSPMLTAYLSLVLYLFGLGSKQLLRQKV